MEEYFGIILLAGIAALLIAKGPKHDPRFVGFMYSVKALLIFLGGCFLIAISSDLGSSHIKNILHVIGAGTAIAGFVGALIGGLKHIKAMFGPIDARRMVEPDYDIPYTECPHCHKVKVRVSGSKAKCPKCGGTIRPSERSDA